jgi:hypothetical protein
MVDYYELKYTIDQLAGRCFIEFYNELKLNNAISEHK